jgi:hypothetical protein
MRLHSVEKLCAPEDEDFYVKMLSPAATYVMIFLTVPQVHREGSYKYRDRRRKHVTKLKENASAEDISC